MGSPLDIKIGEKFGRLTVLECLREETNKFRHYRCICECGKQHYAIASNLTKGSVKSCGCLKRERFKEMIYRKMMNPNLIPTLHPNLKDIYWAAGIYEGEGSAHSDKASGSHITIVQKDDWILNKLKTLFGGSVHQ